MLQLRLIAPRERWDDLARALQEFGRRQQLTFFDTSTWESRGRYSLMVNLCSKSGIWLSADSRVPASIPGAVPDEVRVYLATYKESVDTTNLSFDLKVAFQEWPSVSGDPVSDVR